MTLSNRFERGTRERKLLRSFENGLREEYLSGVALIDYDTSESMVLSCHREDGYSIWREQTDPDAWEDDVFEYSSYEAARKAFDEWKLNEIRPNWEAQAEYDELHGTINGEDPGIVAMRELWGE